MLAELQAESDFLRASREELSSLTAPSPAVAAHRTDLDGLIPILDAVLADGETAVVEDSYEVWLGVSEACTELYDVYQTIPASARASGLTQDTLTQLETAALEASERVFESTEWARTPDDVPTQLAAASTAGAPRATEVASLEPAQTGEPSLGQEDLNAEWGPVVSAAEIMTGVCIVITETNMDFFIGDIGLDRARTEVAAEDEFIGLVRSTLRPPSEAVAGYQEQLTTAMEELSTILSFEPEAMGKPATTDAIGASCLSINALFERVTDEALQAGLSSEALAEFSASDTLVLDDLWYQTKWGR
jgi:hypothetical protein